MVALSLLPASCGCGPPSDLRRVVVYTSVDRHYSEPVLEAFEEKTGIRVDAVYDIEASKTTGLVNTLIAESSNPRADVFWNGEFVQTILLKHKGVLAPYSSASARDIPSRYRDSEGYWVGFAARARVLLVNTDLVEPQDYPASIRDLLSPAWPAERIALAQPLFGTTATHAAALWAEWGAAEAAKFFEEVRDRGVRIVPGNSVVRDMVADGRATWGLTDTDDAASALAAGAPVAVVFPDQTEDGLGTLVIPNTVAMVAGAPRREEAGALIDYLLRPDVERHLVEAGWSHVPVRDLQVQAQRIPSRGVKAMKCGPEDVYTEIEDARDRLRELFLR